MTHSPNNFKGFFANHSKKLLGFSVVFAFALIAALFLLRGSSTGASSADGSRPITIAQRGPLTINVTESGTVQPRKQVILKNDTGDPAALIYVAPEGAHVKVGDLLFELDVTELENDVVERRIRVQNDEADLIHAQENLKVVKNQALANIEQSELTFKFSKQDLTKYFEGEYPKMVKELEAKITLTQEEQIRAQENLKWSKTLFEEKYLSLTEYQRDQLTEQKATLDLELARTDLELLKKYTYHRQLDQLNSDVGQSSNALARAISMAAANTAQANAMLANREAELKEELDRLERQEQRLTKSKVYAPVNGTVIYATSVGDNWRRNKEPIENGTVIRERDEIIYLPTALEYNVVVKITEVDLGKLQEGMEVNVDIDALPGTEFKGRVGSIARLPDPDSRYLNPNLKLYRTEIELEDTEAALRNGMSARVEIDVASFQNVVHVPMQSVVRVGGVPTVYLVNEDDAIIPTEVEIGLDNSRFVVVKNGLEGGEKLMLAPPLDSSSESSSNPSIDAPSRESTTVAVITEASSILP